MATNMDADQLLKDEKPTMPQLSLLEWKKDGKVQEIRVIEEIAKNWRKLGSAGLGMRENVLDNLEDKFSDVNSCRKVFQRFLENGSPKYKTPSWANLIQALRKAEMNVVASTLEEALIGCFQGSKKMEDLSSLQTSFGEPNIVQLMNLVGMTVRNKWRAIGEGLGVKEPDLNSFQTEEAGKSDATQHCMRRVFQKWHDAMTSEYTWQNLIGVLKSPAVDEQAAAQKLYESLTK